MRQSILALLASIFTPFRLMHLLEQIVVKDIFDIHALEPKKTHLETIEQLFQIPGCSDC